VNQITLLVQRLVYHIASLWYRVQKMKENDGQGVGIVILTHGESKYLSEWVVYYLKVLSVDQLIIIDNNSTPDSSIPVLIESFPNQIVTHWEPKPIRSVLNQVALLNKYTSMYKQSFSWIGCIDSDEFVVLPKGYPSLTSFLDSKGAYADSIYLGWKMVGPADSSCFAKTGSLVLSSFHTANDDFPPHQLGKSFVRTGAFGRFLFGPHQPILRGGVVRRRFRMRFTTTTFGMNLFSSKRSSAGKSHSTTMTSDPCFIETWPFAPFSTLIRLAYSV
jgi:hypothetical protein